jgi:ribose 5-phosphate isomerase B
MYGDFVSCSIFESVKINQYMIYIGSDHRGFQLKEKLKQQLTEWGYDYEDVGPFEYNKDDDYPNFAKLVGDKVVEVAGSRGILICGSGIGVCIAVNKIKGIRAGTMAGPEQTKASVMDEDTNVLCLSVDYIDEKVNSDIAKAFLEAEFSGEERHARRVNKIKDLESGI